MKKLLLLIPLLYACKSSLCDCVKNTSIEGKIINTEIVSDDNCYNNPGTQIELINDIPHEVNYKVVCE